MSISNQYNGKIFSQRFSDILKNIAELEIYEFETLARVIKSLSGAF
ncbi:hypothetical protein SAMN02745119_00588 [Trichlorobacter thiogenes]|uniref:Uncharacterized protein n=1 Tax=Trichlorobacter thiogenes TaxID=115783 RepID=A0A1T4KJG4_9BACT|nr:hypothetical protein SAMN02745119_00588 [Trichlorobacter thiogenes]